MIRGFSLVEMLVVLLIAGLLTATVSLSLGAALDGGSGVPSSARKLSNVLRQTQELAVISGHAAGLGLRPLPENGGAWQYSIMQYRDGNWQQWSAQATNDQQSQGRLPASTRLLLELEGEPLSQEQIRQIHQRGDPLLVLLPTGEWPRFALHLERDGADSALLRVSSRGELVVDVAPRDDRRRP